MDSIRVEWIFDQRVYRIHIPGQTDTYLTASDLETLSDAVNAALREAAK